MMFTMQTVPRCSANRPSTCGFPVQARRSKTSSFVCKSTASTPQKAAEAPTEYKDNWLDKIFITLFSRKMAETLGGKPYDGNYDNFVSLSREIMRGRNTVQQRETVAAVLGSLLPPEAPATFRKIFPFNRATAEFNAWLTTIFFAWLVGPSELKDIEIDYQGKKETWRSGVQIKKCRYLEASGCTGLCVNLCKVPTQAFFTDSFGLPLTMQPNFEDMSCTMLYGQVPPPIEQDEAYMQPCLAVCSVGVNSGDTAKPCPKTDTDLPTGWTVRSGSQNQRYLQVDGLRVKYVGEGTDERDAASIRANQPVPNVAIFYFEMEVINKGRDGFIGVGFAQANVNCDRLPGWEPNSFGYHGDDGHRFSGSGVGTPYGPMYSTGDVIGVIYNCVDKTIAYTKNGIDLGVAFTNVPDERLYPTVGMRTPDEEVVVRFAPPFKHDIGHHVQEAIAKATALVHQVPFKAKQGTWTLLGELVYQHLLQEGYMNSAAAVNRDLLDNAHEISERDKHEIEMRQRISAAVLDGRIEDAITWTNALAPTCLEQNPSIQYLLHCQRFIELVCADDSAGALEVGHTHLWPYVQAGGCSEEDKTLLHDALALLAWSNPADSPSAYLLKRPHNAQLAQSLNGALMQSLGKNKVSPLEMVYKQAVAVHKELLAQHDPRAALVNPSQLLAANPGQSSQP